MGVETLPNALGSKAYVHLVARGAEDASMQVKGSVKVYGVLDTGVQDAFS